MSPLSTKRRIKRILYSKPVVAILLVATLFMFRVTWNAYQRMADTGSEVAQIKTRQDNLLTKKVELEKEISYLETPEGVEEELRKKYSATKEGERMVVILDRESTSTDDQAEEPSFIRRAWNWLTSPFR